MHSHMSHNSVQQRGYGSAGYSYSPPMYNPTSYPYSNGSSIQAMSHTMSTTSTSQQQQQDYQGFSVPPYHIDNNQYLLARQNVLPSESSNADSNGSIVSEFDSNHNPIKKKRKPAPTIATGRRNLKDENVNTEEADRRDKRRERNRKSAQRCRERKIEKKDALERQIFDANITCSKYLVLADNVLKGWKQRLQILNEKLPCHNYQSQSSLTDFEKVIEMLHSRSKEASETGDSCSSFIDTATMETAPKSEYNLGPPPSIHNSFIACNKTEPYFPLFDHELNGVVNNSGFDQYQNCIPESNINYIN